MYYVTFTSLDNSLSNNHHKYKATNFGRFLQGTNMALCFIFLLMLLHTHLSLHSNLEDGEIGEFSTLKLNDKSFMEDSSGRRLELHEVHSGPNPISNSFKEVAPDIDIQTAP